MENVREAYAQRYRMIPYLYSLMYEAYKNGKPAMRPLFLEFPNDINCYNDKNLTFMFGSSVLVANVFEKGATTRTVYLPAGEKWFDMNDNMKEYEGGQTIEIPVDLSSIPMFLRGSAIFITTEDIHNAANDVMHNLDILIGAEKDSSFILYDDDGCTNDFENGIFSKTTIEVKSGDKKVISFSREGNYQDTIKKLNLKVVSKEKGAYWVTVDGEKIPQFLTKENWEESRAGWYYNLSDRTVMVKCDKPNKDKFDIVVSCEKFDLIGMVADEE
ncbi:MAG: DUF5110 domain-containing protein [Epulopiscium sp.]|nr:DUF5110 domain-containing protein [Candidatus Epulonipiscium sp.]